MITTYPLTLAGQTAANAVAEPKNVLYTPEGFVVRTGADYIAPIPPTQDELDRAVANAYSKLVLLKGKSPAQIQSWYATNVTGLATTALKLDAVMDVQLTMLIALSILARNL